MAYAPDYFTGAPATHPRHNEIISSEVELEMLQDEYAQLTADDVEWSEAGEARCNELEARIRELQRSIESLNYNE